MIQEISIDKISSHHWIAIPVAPAFNERKPTTAKGQTWMLNVTGIINTNYRPTVRNGWSELNITINRQVIDFAIKSLIDDYAIAYEAPLETEYRIDSYNHLEINGVAPFFKVEHWTLMAGLNTIFNDHESINAGYSVHECRINDFELANPKPNASGSQVPRMFNGFGIKIKVRDIDGGMDQISFQLNLTGKIVFCELPLII